MPRLRPQLAAALIVAASGAAFAQQSPQDGAPAQPQGPISVDLAPVEPAWTKVCANDAPGRKQACYTVRDFGSRADSPIVAFQIFDEKGSDHKLMRLLLPLGVELKPGFRFAVDDGPFESGEFEVCFPAGCFGEAKIKGSLVDSLKKGGKVTVVIKNQTHNEVILHLPLTDFGAAFDGAAIDPGAFAQQQRRLQEELQKKAEEARRGRQGPPDSETGAPKK